MKKNIIFMLIFVTTALFAEFDFSEEIIISNTNIEPVLAYPVDLDGDEDFDVITISGGDNIVGWYENLDGMGNFGAQQIITNDYNIPSCVEVADFDNDSDMDVVVAFYASNMVIWFRHIDGTNEFEIGQIIASDRDGAFGISVGDVDNDNDMDILVASWEDDTLCWYRNLDGLGNFEIAQIIDDNATKACRIIPVDVDEDGDLDVIAATNYVEDKIYWFENSDGLGSFTYSQTITTNVQNVLSICTSYLDNDDDVDILSASTDDDKAAWYENTNGIIGEQQIISTNADDAFHICTSDLNNDGDEDVIVSCGVADRIEVFENLGNAEFGDAQVISSLANFVHSTLPADIDGDGDFDLVSAFWGDGKIVWFRNELATSADDDLHNSISPNIQLWNFPNPFNPNTTIEFSIEQNQQNEQFKIEIYNLKGQKIKSLSSSLCHPELVEGRGENIYSITWNGTDQSNQSVSSGIYYCRLNIPNSPVKKMVLLK
ncbi:MAG: hypothetical protein DRI23_02675 [Candidatus Cloacimonadota bacterium]|nr:MAG: hypothetical protein DRI23_02675 [Candidatus Cloacimonadota bacterium]